MAMVRDLFSGMRAAQLLSRLVLAMGVAPILAPSLGSALLSDRLGRHLRRPRADRGLAVGARLVALPRPCRRTAARCIDRGSLRSYRGLFRDGFFLIMVWSPG